MKSFSGDKDFELSDIRVAAVLVFVILSLAVFFLRAFSVWHDGALFFGAGGAGAVIYPIWEALHHIPVYSWPLKFPFSLSLYNYLYYYTYAWFLRLVDVNNAGIMTWGCLLTPAFAVVGAIAQWKLVQEHLHLRGFRSALSLLFALSLWLCTSIIRGYALSIRPDVAAVAFVMIALWLVVRKPRFGFAIAGVFFYLAWSFKQSVVLAFAGVCLFLLIQKRWRDLSLLVAVFSALVAATILLGTPEYRYNILVAPRLVREFSVMWALQIAPKALVANAYWILAPIVLLLSSSTRRVDHTVRLLNTVFWVSLIGGLAGMTKLGAWDHYLFEALAAGSTLLQIAVFTVPGRLVNALLLFACVQPAIQVAMVPSGARASWVGTVGIATAAEYADAVALRDRLATMKKPIFTTSDVFSLPWFSNGNRAPALVLDTIFHDATRARCQDGCVEAMLEKGEIPTVLLPNAAAPVPPDGVSQQSGQAAGIIGVLKKLLGGGDQGSLHPGPRSDAIYRNSLSSDYKKVGEYPYAGGMWTLYSLSPRMTDAGSPAGQSSPGAH